MSKQIVHAEIAPRAVGTYSQAILVGGTVYLSGQLGIYLTDMANFADLNRIMRELFVAPYSARSAVQVAGLPRGGIVEADAVMVLLKRA